MTAPDPGAFIEKFQRMWRDPQPETFADLFAEDGTLFHPTMERPIGRAEVPEYGVQIEGADRFTLRGDRAAEGVAYFDTIALWAKVDPTMDRGHLLDAAHAGSGAGR